MKTWSLFSILFQQGNSNSVSTVDVSAGYIVVSEYNPVIVSICMFMATYAGTILWLLGYLKILFNGKKSKEWAFTFCLNLFILLVYQPDYNRLTQALVGWLTHGDQCADLSNLCLPVITASCHMWKSITSVWTFPSVAYTKIGCCSIVAFPSLCMVGMIKKCFKRTH